MEAHENVMENIFKCLKEFEDFIFRIRKQAKLLIILEEPVQIINFW